MTTLRRAVLVAVGSATVAVGLLGTGPTVSASPGQAPEAPCYNGIAPFNPYVDNCAIPQRPPHILGAAPDQTAILNCSIGGKTWRAVCLSQFVNGGPYPGIAVGIG